MNENGAKELLIAKWKDRFFAWLIDFVVVWTGVFLAYSAVGASVGYAELSHLAETADFENYANVWAAHGFWVGCGTSIVFFAYWSILEGLKGQSLGKRILGIKAVNIDGSPLSMKQSLLNSFGKSFLFSIDVILGLIFTRNKRQRIFGRLSNSVVIKIKEKEEQGVAYKLD